MIRNSYILYGAGGHARSVADIILSSNPEAKLTFIDDLATKDGSIIGFPILKTEEELPEDTHVIICIGSIDTRKVIFHRFPREKLASVVSKTAHLGRDSSVGKGSFIGNFVHIGPATFIGDNCIINNGTILEHDVQVGHHVNIGPGSVIAGSTVIEDDCDIGCGATIKNNIRICSGTIIGAGSVVVRDIASPGVYAGVPAKLLGDQR